MENSLAGKIALITGASRGIGRAVAKKYAELGAHVILVARTVGALEKLDDEIKAFGGTATIVPLDITDFVKIDELGFELYKRFGKLDIFVGNAGMLGMLSPVAHTDPKTWDKVIATNLTANFRFIRSFDPLFKAAESPKAIFVTSDVVDGSELYWGAYAASKAALEVLAKTYAAENANINKLKVELVDPGSVGTKMYAAAFPGADLSKMKQPEDVVSLFI